MEQSDSWLDEIADQAQRALDSSAQRWTAAIVANPDNPLGAVLEFYLSMEHREEKMDGCAIAALGSDAARQSSVVKHPFEWGVRAHLKTLCSMVSASDDEEANGKAIAILSTMLGAVTLSSVVNDPELARSFLTAAQRHIREAFAQGSGVRDASSRCDRDAIE